MLNNRIFYNLSTLHLMTNKVFELLVNQGMRKEESWLELAEMVQRPLGSAIERRIADKGSPDSAYAYVYYTGQPCPLMEPTVANNAEYAYYYAKYFLRGPFPLGEDAILSSNYKDSYRIFLAKNK